MNQNLGTAQDVLGQLGSLLDAQWKIQKDEWTRQGEDMKLIKNMLAFILKWCNTEHTKDQENLQKLEKDIYELREKYQAEQSRAETLKERVEQQEQRISDLKAEKEALSQQHQDALQRQTNESQQTINALQKKLDGLRQELGCIYPDFEALYRRFMESPWAQRDTAMRRLYGEDYVVFFARCGSEQIVKQFHEDLHAVIQSETDGYRELADKLLDFCAAACGRLHPSSVYTRQVVQPGDPYNYRNHKQCGTGDGKVSHLLLRGIERDGQTFLHSFVEREA